MDLIERYLSAVRWNLPAAKADDIIAELRDELASRIEDREDALDRALTQDELAALLKEHGHPLGVAGRYHGQRALIGPEVFPFYWFVLRIVLAIGLVVEAVQIAGRLIGGDAATRAITQGVHDAAGSLLVLGAVVTLGFALIERSGWLATYLAQWRPEQLPPARLHQPARKPWETGFEIAAGIAFLLWWVGAFDVAVVPADAPVAVTLAPVWEGLFWPVVALTVARILFQLVELVRPMWKAVRAMLSVGTAAGTVAIAAVLYQAGRIVTVVPLNDSARGARPQEHLDQSLHIALGVIALIAVIQCAVELRRIARQR